MNIYAMMDTERQVYSPIFLGEDDVIAKRIYAQSVSKSPFWEQTKLYCLGKFDNMEHNVNPISLIEPEEVETTENDVKVVWDYEDSKR